MESERRSNDSLILSKLQNLDEKFDSKFDTLERKFTVHLIDDKEHKKQINHAVYGNGSAGIKTTLEVVKSRVSILSLFLIGAWSAIISTFFKGN